MLLSVVMLVRRVVVVVVGDLAVGGGWCRSVY